MGAVQQREGQPNVRLGSRHITATKPPNLSSGAPTGGRRDPTGRWGADSRIENRIDVFCETLQEQLWEQLRQHQPETQMGTVRQGKGQPDKHLGSRHKPKGNRQWRGNGHE